MRKEENKEVKRRGRPRTKSTTREDARRKETLEAYEEMRESLDKFVKENEKFALAVMFIPNVDEKLHRAFKGNKKTIKGLNCFLSDCNTATLEIITDQMEKMSKRITMENPTLMLMKLKEKLREQYEDDEDDMEDEDDEFEW